MKKIIAFVMAMVVVLAMAGCAGSGINVNINGGTTTAPAANGTTAAAEGTEGTDVTTLPDETKPVPPVETEPQETEPAATEPQESSDILGEVDGYTYTNMYLGIKAELEGYTFMSETELVEQNGLAAGATVVDIENKASGEADAFIFYATSADSLNTVNIMLNIGTAADVQSLNTKETLMSVIDTLVAQYQAMGFTNIACEYNELEIGGQTFDGLLLEAEIGGQTFSLLMFMFTGENFAATVTMGGLDAEGILEIASTVEVL